MVWILLWILCWTSPFLFVGFCVWLGRPSPQWLTNAAKNARNNYMERKGINPNSLEGRKIILKSSAVDRFVKKLEEEERIKQEQSYNQKYMSN